MFDNAIDMFMIAAGVVVVIRVLVSAIRFYVLPRMSDDWIVRVFFSRVVFRGFRIRLRFSKSYEERERITAYFAPVALLAMPFVWLSIIAVAYTLIYWGLNAGTWHECLRLSGSSMLTLGFVSPDTGAATYFVFSEAATGVIVAALLVSYLPTMYSAFSEREQLVAMLAVRAGEPPSPIELLRRFHAIGHLDATAELWPEWERWFVSLSETHTSLPSLVFYRSPNPARSWITASGVILDAAALLSSTVDMPRDPRRELCIAAGADALTTVSQFLNVGFVETERGANDLAVSRQEFDAACATLAEAGIPLKSDLDQAWRDYAGWRLNYDAALMHLCGVLFAPLAVWSADRPGVFNALAKIQRVRRK